LIELIDNLSGDNTRTALTFLYTFIGGDYVSTQRVLNVAQAGRRYVVPMHEFIRATVFGQHDYYDPTASAICNVFDLTTDDGREHFRLLNLLAYIQRSGEAAGSKGFVKPSDVYTFGQALGFSPEQIGAQLSRAIECRDHRYTDNVAQASGHHYRRPSNSRPTGPCRGFSRLS
jgi:hypothetical protein